jgi:hypothetical protein
MGNIMTFQTLGYLSAFLFLLVAGAWIVVLERSRRREEKRMRIMAYQLERVRALREMAE